MLTADQVRLAYLALAHDLDRLAAEVDAADREHGGDRRVPLTQRQIQAQADYDAAMDQWFRLERLLSRMEDEEE